MTHTRPDLDPAVDVAPFDLGPADASGGVLCLHGLTGTPYEVRPLGEALAARGFRSVGPALPGHNETPEALARLSYDRWVEASESAFEALAARHERVFVAGLSLGGLLALTLAARQPVAGAAVVGTPLRLRGLAPYLIPVVRHVVPYLVKRQGSDIRDDAARARHPSYPVMPLASVQQLQRLQREVRRELGRVTEPLFVAHGRLDGTAHPDDAQRIHDGVASKERALLWLDDSGHVVPVDHDGPRLAEALADFFEARL